MYHLHDARHVNRNQQMNWRANCAWNIAGCVTWITSPASEPKLRPAAALHRRARSARWGWPYSYRHGHAAALGSSRSRAKIGPVTLCHRPSACACDGAGEARRLASTGPGEGQDPGGGGLGGTGVGIAVACVVIALAGAGLARCRVVRNQLSPGRRETKLAASGEPPFNCVDCLERIRVIHGRSPLWVAVLG